MPTQGEYSQLKTDLETRRQQVDDAYTNVSAWIRKWDLPPEKVAQIDDILQDAATAFSDANLGVEELKNLAEERRKQCKAYTDEYASWFRSNSGSWDWDNAPEPDFSYIEYGY